MDTLTSRFTITGNGRRNREPVEITLHADTQDEAEHKALLLAVTTGHTVEVVDTHLVSA